MYMPKFIYFSSSNCSVLWNDADNGHSGNRQNGKDDIPLAKFKGAVYGMLSIFGCYRFGALSKADRSHWD